MKELSSKDKKRLEKQRKTVSRQAQKFHKEQDKRAKKSSGSKIKDAVNARPKKREENLSREERFRRESDKKIRDLEPRDFDDGYYIDEYSARRKQKRRLKEIHEQEKEVIHRRKKLLTSSQVKRRRILIYSAIFAVVLIVGVVLSLTVLFKTENILVEGDKYYSEEQIIAFSGVQKQENIFIAAMSNTSDKIKENLPYVEDASISFSIPDTVIIKITDAVPSYVVKNGDSYLIVSSKGRILESVAENKDKLPELKCDELKSVAVGSYVSFNDDNIPDILQNISESLNTNKFEKITSFDVTDTSNIAIVYDNRIKINLGLPADIDYKIRTAMAIINDKLDPNHTGTIAGTLDVSACNTTKVSHYKPAETTVAPSTSPSDPSVQSSTSAYGYDDNNYTWDGSYTWSEDYSLDNNYYDNNDYNSYDNGGYEDDNTYNYDDNGGYDGNNYSYDNGYDYGYNYGDYGDGYADGYTYN